jgi:hypothetical protein
VIGVAAQDVQISSSMTGGHVGASPLALLTDEGSPKSFLGALISGAVFFWVLFFSLYKEKYHAAKGRNQSLIKNNEGYIDWILAYASMTKGVLDSRLRGNDK